MAGFQVVTKLDKMGWRGSPLAQIAFDDVRVPLSHVLGEPDTGVRAPRAPFESEMKRSLTGVFSVIALLTSTSAATAQTGNL